MNNQKSQQLQHEWERAIEQATEAQITGHALGEMLQEASGLHIKSGVEAGGIWGSTSCTCEQTCNCF